MYNIITKNFFHYILYFCKNIRNRLATSITEQQKIHGNRVSYLKQLDSNIDFFI